MDKRKSSKETDDLEVLKKELASIISHTVRTPLTMVKEGLSLLLSEIPGQLNPKQKKVVAVAKENIDRLTRSIENILKTPWDNIMKQNQENPGGAKKMSEKKRILIVEDETELVEMMKMRLEARDYEIISAYDGREGLEKAKKEKPDLIILDLMLPKMDGYKVCGLLKKDTRYTKIPIIMFTARAQEEDIKLGEELGAEAYITKPFEPQVLLGKIKEFLGE